jgi:hypothetical protein
VTDTEVAISTGAGLWRVRVSESWEPGLARLGVISPFGTAGMNLSPDQLEELATSLATLAQELRIGAEK